LAACWANNSKKMLRYSERAGKGNEIDGLVEMAEEHRKLGQWKMMTDKLGKATHMQETHIVKLCNQLNQDEHDRITKETHD